MKTIYCEGCGKEFKSNDKFAYCLECRRRTTIPSNKEPVNCCEKNLKLTEEYVFCSVCGKRWESSDETEIELTPGKTSINPNNPNNSPFSHDRWKEKVTCEPSGLIIDKNPNVTPSVMRICIDK